VGIFKGLHRRRHGTTAGRGSEQRSALPHLSPIIAMQQGGIPLMLDVRRMSTR
jgi:hypothetical protein